MKFKADTLHEILREMRTEAVHKLIGELITDQMRASLEAGISPVKGVRRFEKYKNPKKYPGKLKSKLPVNLKLEGDMYNALTYWSSRGRLVIGFKDKDEAEKAKAHNEGIGVPQRRFMPTDDGEELNVSITRAVRNLYAEIVSGIIRRTRGK